MWNGETLVRKKRGCARHFGAEVGWRARCPLLLRGIRLPFLRPVNHPATARAASDAAQAFSHTMNRRIRQWSEMTRVAVLAREAPRGRCAQCRPEAHFGCARMPIHPACA